MPSVTTDSATTAKVERCLPTGPNDDVMPGIGFSGTAAPVTAISVSVAGAAVSGWAAVGGDRSTGSATLSIGAAAAGHDHDRTGSSSVASRLTAGPLASA